MEIGKKFLLSGLFSFALGLSTLAFAGNCYKIVVNNPNDVTLRDYQIRLDFNKLNISPTIDKLKILDEYGNSLPYCFEQPNPRNKNVIFGECNETIPTNGNVVVWVKTKELDPGKNVLFITIGGSPSSGDKVFDFYDDFNEGELDSTKWSVYTYPDVYPPGSPTYTFKDGSIILNHCPYCGIEILSKKEFNPSVILEASGYVSTAERNYPFMGFSNPTIPARGQELCSLPIPRIPLNIPALGLYTAVGYDGYGIFVSKKDDKHKSCGRLFYLFYRHWSFPFDKFQVEWTKDYAKIYIHRYDTFLNRWLHAYAIIKGEGNIPSTPLKVAFESYDGWDSLTIDWVRVRKWAPKEPTIDSASEIACFSQTAKVGEGQLCIINNSDYTIPAGYQVKVDLSQLYTQLKDFVTDVEKSLFRITYNGKEVNYCYEYPNGECKADPPTNPRYIWVKLPINIPAHENLLLNFYIEGVTTTDSPTAVNGNEVFDFYDDFDDGSLDSSKWSTNAYDNFAIENGYIKLWGDWNDAASSLSGPVKGDHYLSPKKSFEAPIIIEFRGRIGQINADSDLGIQISNKPNPIFWKDGLTLNYDGNGGSSCYNVKDIGLNGDCKVKGEKIKSTDWQLIRITYTNNKVSFWDSWTAHALEYSDNFWNNVYISLGADTDSVNRYGYVDWIRVRKYVPQPPQTCIKIKVCKKFQ